MDIRNLFKHGRKISSNVFRQNYRQSKMTQEFLKNEKIARVLDRKPEQDEFNRAMYDKSKGGLSGQEMRETIGELNKLTETEKRLLAKEIFPNLPSDKRILRPKMDNRSVSAVSGSTEPSENSSRVAAILNKSRPAYSPSTPENKPENRYERYYEAMKSIRENKI